MAWNTVLSYLGSSLVLWIHSMASGETIPMNAKLLVKNHLRQETINWVSLLQFQSQPEHLFIFYLWLHFSWLIVKELKMDHVSKESIEFSFPYSLLVSESEQSYQWLPRIYSWLQRYSYGWKLHYLKWI